MVQIQVTSRELNGIRKAVLDAWTDHVFDQDPKRSEVCEKFLREFMIDTWFDWPVPRTPRVIEISDLTLEVVARSLAHSGTWMDDRDMRNILDLAWTEWEELRTYIEACRAGERPYPRWPEGGPTGPDPQPSFLPVDDPSLKVTYGHTVWRWPRTSHGLTPTEWIHILIETLDRLAAPADGQIEYLATLGAGDVDELGLAFQDVYVRFTRGFPRERSPLAVDACVEVDTALRSPDLGWEFTDLDSPAWAEIRVLAATAAKALRRYLMSREDK